MKLKGPALAPFGARAPAVFAPRRARPEGGHGIKALTHQTLWGLGRASLSDGDMAAPKLEAMEISQGCRRQFSSGHCHEGISARLSGAIDYDLD